MALILDTETTGLILNGSVPLDKQPTIIEFYGVLVDLDTGETHGELELLIKPPTPVSEEITRINGITNEDLANAPSFREVAPRIKQFIEAAPRVVAANASFDKEMIDLDFKRLGEIVAWPRITCSVEQTIYLLGYRLSLTALHTHLFGEGFPAAHRARTDVEALARCCVELRKRGDL